MTRPDPISLRLPEALKASIQQSANAAGRSLNAEIRMRLEHSFQSGFDGTPSDQMLANEIESLRSEFRGSIHNVNAAIKALDGRLAELEDNE